MVSATDGLCSARRRAGSGYRNRGAARPIRVANHDPPARPRPDGPQEPCLTFDNLGLSADILRAVADEGYTEPTPIQAQAIPLVLAGRDVLAAAQTGVMAHMVAVALLNPKPALPL